MNKENLIKISKSLVMQNNIRPGSVIYLDTFIMHYYTVIRIDSKIPLCGKIINLLTLVPENADLTKFKIYNE